MIESLNSLDTSIFLFFNGIHSTFFDRFMMLFTDRFIWVPFYAFIAFAVVRSCGWRRGLFYLAAIGLAITLTDQTCSSIIRPMAERMRPSNLMNPLSEFARVVDDYRGGDFGFPSCHAANSFSLAVFITLLFPRWRVGALMFGWALLNSYSRLYLGVHYPGDLFIGSLIGVAFAFICWVPARLIARRITPSSTSLTAPIFSITPRCPVSAFTLMLASMLTTVVYIILFSI